MLLRIWYEVFTKVLHEGMCRVYKIFKSSYCHLLVLMEHNLHPLLLTSPAHEHVHWLCVHLGMLQLFHNTPYWMPTISIISHTLLERNPKKNYDVMFPYDDPKASFSQSSIHSTCLCTFPHFLALWTKQSFEAPLRFCSIVV